MHGTRGLFALFVAPAVFWGCKDKPLTPPKDDAGLGRRVVRPPPIDDVRALPPHNIHPSGVGPFSLSDTLQETLALLPSQDRGVELFEVEGLFDYRLLRSSNNALLIGAGRRGNIEFVSILDPAIAHTEEGLGVGAQIQALTNSLGPQEDLRDYAHDPRIVRFRKLPHTRFVVEKSVVTAIVAGPNVDRGPFLHDLKVDKKKEKKTKKTDNKQESEKTQSSKLCDAGDLIARTGDLVAFAKERLSTTEALSLQIACLHGGQGEAVVRHGDTLIVLGIDAEGAVRQVATLTEPGSAFVALLGKEAERARIYTVSEYVTPQVREVVLRRHALQGARFVLEWEARLFRLEAKTATWIGAELNQTDFLVELTLDSSSLVVGGLFLQRDRADVGLRNVVPLKETSFPLLDLDPAGGGTVAPTSTDAGATSGLGRKRLAPRPNSRDAGP